MRKIATKDICAAARIIKKSGMKEELVPLVKLAAERSVEDIGIEGILTVLEVVSEKKCEDAVYDVLSGPLEIPAKDIAVMPLDELTHLLEELAAQNNIRNFFKALSGMITSKSLT